MNRLVIACLAVVGTCATAQETRDALASGDLICEVRHGFRRDVFAAIERSRPIADLMLVYEAVASPAARVVSSQRPGRHPVDVRVTPAAVHLIEPVGPSVRHTALTRCLQKKFRNGEETCVRFAARHAWHFDLGAYADPDAAMARIANSVSRGVCEPWLTD